MVSAVFLFVYWTFDSRVLFFWLAFTSFLLRLLCISINQPYGHVWNAGVMSGLVFLVATWNCWISYKNRYVGPSLAASLELLVHCWIVASLSLFYRYYFGRCSSELTQLVPLILKRGLFAILIDCIIFCHYS